MSTRAVRMRTWALGAAAIASFPCTVHANPLDLFGFGSREAALGGAGVAGARGAAANYYNPSLLVRTRSLEVAMGYMFARHDLRMNGRAAEVDDVRGFSGGLALPGHVAGIPVACGLGLHLPDARLSRVRAQRQEEPRFELYDNRNQRLVLAANLAIAPWPWLTLGGGISFMSSTAGRLAISGSATVLGTRPSLIRHEVDADLSAIRTPQFGASVQLSRAVTLGAAYRGEFKLGLALDARVLGDISGLTTAVFDLQTRSINNFLPAQVVFGGAFALSKRITLSIDATYMQWSAYRAPAADLSVAIDIPPPAGGWPAGITPPTTPAKQVLLPLVLRDRVAPHVGLEVRIWDAPRATTHLRAGYDHLTAPIGAQPGLTNYVDRTRHSFSAGAGVAWHRPFAGAVADLVFDVHAQLHHLVTADTRKADPADLVGDYRAGGNIFAFGATITTRFQP